MIADGYSLDCETPSLGSKAQGCFYCGEPTGLPVIEWHGDNRTMPGFEVIQFHPECAVEFSIRLLRDVHEFECRILKRELRENPAEKIS